MFCYTFDKNGIFSGREEIMKDPFSGEWLLPPDGTLKEPPEQKQGFVSQWNGEDWTSIENHIGEVIYNSNGEPRIVETLGSLPDDVFLSADQIPMSREKYLEAIKKECLLNAGLTHLVTVRKGVQDFRIYFTKQIFYPLLTRLHFMDSPACFCCFGSEVLILSKEEIESLLKQLYYLEQNLIEQYLIFKDVQEDFAGKLHELRNNVEVIFSKQIILEV